MKKIVFVLMSLFGLACANGVDATLEVVKKFGNLPNILVQNVGSDYFEREFSQRIFKMLIADLKVTGHFTVQEEKEVISSEMLVNFDEYRKNKIDLVARIKAEKSESGVIARLHLYDVNSGLVALSKEYKNMQQETYPFLAHKMAIDINAYIKAPSVDWMERMVILAYYTKPGESDIIMSDYTLTYKKKVISGGLNIFPKWANAAQNAFYYTKYLDKPTLFKFDLGTGQNKKMFDSSGMLVASDVSNDENKILVTMAPNEQPDIFMYDITNGALKRLTKYSGIDVSGNFIDNEERVMFISDRLGYPNVFAIPASGEVSGNVEQMVFHGRNNNAANANGNYIVYSSRESNEEFDRNTFNLYLVSTKSDFIRRLSANGVNQLPRFSKDGETIMYIKHEANQSALGIIRLNYNKTLLFPLQGGVIQSMDW
ncbi:Tol-Pal system protein TolB [Helicobacter winghamensis]|uniref:Translocation protein TolB n=1 Tax=Helicobacter winghamensis TaxID=157268 RepID=A0A2N3PL28_9HELI|nr:Tol-Pal system protein TolB [Helicobacter winghamensis]PKT79240.1 translocation protein TolB [Helicobacter winghamensis]PKT79314.1 translocation protein TolB [Helicobacter winghamensis]PKT79444.1 translocation protein TolB [Helicobacter winghamensis]PKT82405.1 translocation protein TolB [Helicobacter winghamensis]PKT82548.1 translocation protein TolB [Helicobacter winghamensis]